MLPNPHGRSAGNKRRRFWFDPRFAIGLVLVAASVAGVVAVVAAADSSVEVMSARVGIAPGATVSAGDMVATEVRAGRVAGLYLSAADLPAGGVVLTRSIAAGELVPVSAVAATSGLEFTSMVLSLTPELPQSVEAGSRLDVWSSREGESGVFAAPTVIVAAAIVVRIVEDEAMMAGSASSAVEVLVPRSAVAGVLEAVANGAVLSAVPVDLPAGQ